MDAQEGKVMEKFDQDLKQQMIMGKDLRKHRRILWIKTGRIIGKINDYVARVWKILFFSSNIYWEIFPILS